MLTRLLPEMFLGVGCRCILHSVVIHDMLAKTWLEIEHLGQKVRRFYEEIQILLQEGLNEVNRLATKCKERVLTTNKTRKKLPTSDKENLKNNRHGSP